MTQSPLSRAFLKRVDFMSPTSRMQLQNTSAADGEDNKGEDIAMPKPMEKTTDTKPMKETTMEKTTKVKPMETPTKVMPKPTVKAKRMKKPIKNT